MRRYFLIALFSILSSPTCQAQTDSMGGSMAESSSCPTKESRAKFVLSRIDERVVRELEYAWNKSAHGIKVTEALVLIFRMADGSIKALPGGHTNEAFKFSFKWNPATIAIIHTHPNNKAPEPQEPDIIIADRFGVPMFTIALSGMYMYDPKTKKTTKIHDGLDWLEPSKWARYSQLAVSK